MATRAAAIPLFFFAVGESGSGLIGFVHDPPRHRLAAHEDDAHHRHTGYEWGSLMVVDPMLMVAKDQAAAAWAGFWANVFVAMATMVAVAVALGISIAQFRREAAKEKRIAVAIAPALLGDLNYVLEAVETISSNAFEVKNLRMANHEIIEDVLRAATQIRLPAFDRFKDMLPSLGDRTAPVVIECYAIIVRTAAEVEILLRRESPTQALPAAVATSAENVSRLKTRIQAAQEALRPMTLGALGNR